MPGAQHPGGATRTAVVSLSLGDEDKVSATSTGTREAILEAPGTCERGITGQRRRGETGETHRRRCQAPCASGVAVEGESKQLDARCRGGRVARFVQNSPQYTVQMSGAGKCRRTQLEWAWKRDERAHGSRSGESAACGGVRENEERAGAIAGDQGFRRSLIISLAQRYRLNHRRLKRGLPEGQGCRRWN